MVHITDLIWGGNPDEALKTYKRGDNVRVKILEINVKKERVSLGIKQMEPDPFLKSVASLKEGEVTTCTVLKVQEGGILVEIVGDGGTKVESFIRRGDLSRNRSEQRPDRHAAGEKVDAQIMGIDKKQRKLMLSIKAREVAEAKEVTSTYGSADSGAVLGDILGKAIEEKEAREGGKVASKEKPTKKGKKEEKEETKAAKGARKRRERREREPDSSRRGARGGSRESSRERSRGEFRGAGRGSGARW